MGDFIETLKVRTQDSQRRYQAAQQKFNAAQAELQAAQQEFNSWNYALAMENRKAQLEAAQAAAAQAGPPAPVVAPTVTPTPITNMPEVNKTALVRGVLHQHPTGMTPNEIARELKDQVGSAYIYSVLKRLKDREEVSKKRGGKYYLKHPHSEEVAAQNGAVQQH